MHHYQHHIGDYDAATAHLSWDEDLAYSRLLRVYYRDEKLRGFSLADIFRLVRAKTKKEKLAVESVLSEFFVRVEGGWINKRCEEEIGRFREKSTKAKSSADARWNRCERIETAHANADAIAMLTVNRKPPTANHHHQPPQKESGGGGEKKILEERLRAIGFTDLSAAEKALSLRPFAIVMETLDHFENHFRLADGTIAFDSGLGYVYWRIAKPECAEQNPAKAWMEPDNEVFIKRRKNAADAARREQERYSSAKRDETTAEPNEAEALHGPIVDAMDWNEAEQLAKDSPRAGMLLPIIARSRRAAGSPGKSVMVRTALIRILAESASGVAAEVG